MLDTRTERAELIGQALGLAPSDTLTLRLAERKISPDVISLFNIRPHEGKGWTYETPRGALRFKNVNSDSDTKYFWIGDKRDSLLYAFDLREAIEQAGFSVWLVTEFDVFAMRSAHIWHVIGQLMGEGSVPDDLPALLQSMGVLTCYIAPDNDDAGTRWAQLVTDKLLPFGIDVVVRTLPDKTPGADLGKAWAEYTSKRPFERFLLDIPATRLQLSPPQPIKPAQIVGVSDDIKQAIAQALNVQGFNDKGYSKPIKCRFHDDQKPSAALHKDFGLHCFVCGWHKWKDLAEVLGITWGVTTTPAPYYRSMLAVEVMQAMNAAGFSVLANSLESMYKAGWGVGREFTHKELASLLSQKRARTACEQMQGKGYDKRKKPSKVILARLFPYFSLPLKKGKDSGKKSKGQPAKVYRLPSPDEIAKVFDVNPRHYWEIAEKKKLADWRAEVHAAPIDMDAGTYTRSELCKPLGISSVTSRAYCKRAGVTVIPHEERKQIKSMDTLPEKGTLKACYLTTDDGHNFPASRGAFERAQKHGGRVWLVRRLANEYSRSKQYLNNDGEQLTPIKNL